MGRIWTHGAVLAFLGLALVACAPGDDDSGSDEANEGAAAIGFEAQVDEYIRAFPYQDTYDYLVRYTDRDPAMFNRWVLGETPALVKAGEDKIVRMNNDTFYKLAFVMLDEGPVVLTSAAPADDRFYSFQLMDDRNVNYRNVIRPAGRFTLFRGEQPAGTGGEAIEVPSDLSVVIVRVEVKDTQDPADVAAAETVFNGITIEGPTIPGFPEVDLLSGFPPDVAEEAQRRIDEAIASIPFAETVVGPGQEPGRDVPYLNLAAGTKSGWGGPHASHSSYEILFDDADGNPFDGSKGTYTVTTEEPPVDAFWSLTVYDTGRGGYFHPNRYDRYHINNTTAVRNPDGTVTFTFRTSCAESYPNCVEVPSGPFDITARYYLPREPILSGAWMLPGIRLTARSD